MRASIAGSQLEVDPAYDRSDTVAVVWPKRSPSISPASSLRENMPRLADALDALLVVLKDNPTHLRIDDKRGS